MMALLCQRESRHLEQQAWKETVELMKNHLELGSEHLTCLRFLSKGFVGVVKGEVKGAADVVGLIGRIRKQHILTKGLQLTSFLKKK